MTILAGLAGTSVPHVSAAPTTAARPTIGAGTTPRGPGIFAALLAATIGDGGKGPAAAARPPAAPERTAEPSRGNRYRDRDQDGRPTDAGARPKAPSGPDLLDPAARNPALVPSPVASPAEAQAGVEAPRARASMASMEELLPALVRRIAWAGDRHRASVRLELGAGAWSGTTLLVHADGGRVRVEVHGASGAHGDELRRRLDARLRGHGLDVESVT
jgi:hypothetical protein